MYIRALFALAISLFVASQASGWTKDLHFNDGVVGTSAVGSDGFNSAATDSRYDSEEFVLGGQSVKMHISEGETAHGEWGGYIAHPEHLYAGDEIWVRAMVYWPSGFNYDSYAEGGKLKFIRVHTRSEEDSNQGYNDWYIDDKASTRVFQFIYEGGQEWSNFGVHSDKPQYDVWETYEMYIKFHPIPKADGGEAVVRVWKNGVLLSEILDRKTLVSFDTYSDRTHIFTYWNGGSPQTQHLWMDEIMVTSDQPSGRDAHGNPYIGPAGASTISPPKAPSNFQVINH